MGTDSLTSKPSPFITVTAWTTILANGVCVAALAPIRIELSDVPKWLCVSLYSAPLLFVLGVGLLARRNWGRLRFIGLARLAAILTFVSAVNHVGALERLREDGPTAHFYNHVHITDVVAPKFLPTDTVRKRQGLTIGIGLTWIALLALILRKLRSQAIRPEFTADSDSDGNEKPPKAQLFPTPILITVALFFVIALFLSIQPTPAKIDLDKDIEFDTRARITGPIRWAIAFGYTDPECKRIYGHSTLINSRHYVFFISDADDRLHGIFYSSDGRFVGAPYYYLNSNQLLEYFKLKWPITRTQLNEIDLRKLYSRFGAVPGTYIDTETADSFLWSIVSSSRVDLQRSTKELRREFWPSLRRRIFTPSCPEEMALEFPIFP